MPLMALAEEGSREFHAPVNVNHARFHWGYSSSVLTVEDHMQQDFQRFPVCPRVPARIHPARHRHAAQTDW